MLKLLRDVAALLRPVSGVVLLAVAGHAVAGDWDHDANIDAAVDGMVEAFKVGGMAQVERVVVDCYRDR